MLYNIKKHLKSIAILFLCILFFACDDKNDNLGAVPLGVTLNLKTTEINNLDGNHPMEITIYEDTSKINKLEVSSDDGVTKELLTVTNQKAIFSSSILDSINYKKSIPVKIFLTLDDGRTFEKIETVSISKTLSLVDEISAIKYGYAADSENDTLSFKTATKSAVISSVALSWKEGKNGTYVVATAPLNALNVKGDSIPFVNVSATTYGYGLNIKDTLYYRFIATSGTLKDTLEVSIPIISQAFETVSSAIISSNVKMNKLNLETGTVYADTDAEGKGEIKFKSTFGFVKEGTTAIDFVKVGDLSSESDYVNTKAKLFAEKDLLVAKKLYDAGTKITETATTAKDDLFIYKITRNVVPATDPITTVIKYGMIKIGDIVTTNEETEINIKYGEGEIE